MRLQQNTKSADYRTQLQQFVNLGILPANTNLDAVTLMAMYQQI
jgi:hypothetical protein